MYTDFFKTNDGKMKLKRLTGFVCDHPKYLGNEYNPVLLLQTFKTSITHAISLDT